ncbi:MAG TPA: GNAT family N-acetyltransferase [Gaiellaceae bacterium]|nr:GNAT family N-acetyltransferase [Gaiellaceae bacterium]
MNVERVTRADEELAAAFARLVPQLSKSSSPPTLDELHDLVAFDRTHLLVARDDEGTIVGTLTLAVYRIPLGLRAIIEDVVVDESARGQGVGEALTREAQRTAAELGVSAIWLTTAPAREAANRLYPRLGFEQRETNVYVWRPG